MNAIRLGGILVAVVLVAACGAGVLTPSSTPSPTMPCRGVGLAADWGPYVIAGFTEEGTLHGFPLQSHVPDAAVGATIVLGKVLGFEAGVAEPPDGGRDWRVFTPVRVAVEMVIEGEVEPGGFRFFIEGGKAGCLTEVVDTAPSLPEGARFVFFLYPMRISERVVHTDRLVLTRDAWYVDDRDMVSTPGGPMALADFVERIRRIVAAASPTPGRT